MYNLNIVKSNVVQTNVIIGRIMDKPIDTLDFRIYNGHEPMDLTGCTLEFKGTTPDGNKVTSKSVQIKNSKQGDISFTVPENMYSARGRFKNAYFTVTKGSRVDSTNDIIIDVLNAVYHSQEEANEIKDMLDEILKESQAKVDKYVNDAIKDTQSKLDKHLKDSEAKVTAEMQKLQNSVANVNANMSALEKDVASFKVTMDKELARMQKQLDDLAKAINQTNIQRPQITNPSGGHIHSPSKVYTYMTDYVFGEINRMGIFKVTLSDKIKNAPIQYLNGILNIIDIPTKSYSFIATSHANGNTYTCSDGAGFSVHEGKWTVLNFGNNALEIGGSNFIEDSNFTIERQYNTWTIKPIEAKFSDKYGYGIYFPKEYDSSGRAFVSKKQLMDEVYLPAGTPVTLSASILRNSIKSSSQSEAFIRFFLKGGGMKDVKTDNFSTLPQDGKFHRLVTTSIIPQDVDYSKPAEISLALKDKGEVIYCQYIKLERGHVASDWTDYYKYQHNHVTSADGNFKIQLSDKTKTTEELISTIPNGNAFISFGEGKDLPESWIYGFVSSTAGSQFRSFIGTSVTGKVYNYNNATNVWKRLDS